MRLTSGLVGERVEQVIDTACVSLRFAAYMWLAPRSCFCDRSTGKILKLLAKKVSSGVVVMVMLNRRYPNGWLTSRSETERARLRKIGVEVKTFSSKRILHSKYIIVDDRLALLGSANMTSHSLDRNHETIIEVDDCLIVKELSKSFFDMWKS